MKVQKLTRKHKALQLTQTLYFFILSFTNLQLIIILAYLQLQILRLTDMSIKKLLLVAIFFIAAMSNFAPGRPDAIQCSNSRTDIGGQIYMAHGVVTDRSSMYCQTYALEDRCIVFNDDGSYRSGAGHYDSRKYCENKSLTQLQQQGRTYEFARKSTQEKQKVPLTISNFLDYEQIKKLWFEEFKHQILEEIKQNILTEFKTKLLGQIVKNGLLIGSRWKITQQANNFVIIDLQASKVKDSRVTIYAGTHSNLI